MVAALIDDAQKHNLVVRAYLNARRPTINVSSFIYC